MNESKTCKECGKVKPLTCFGKNRTYSDGHDSKCKECRAAYYKQYAKRNAAKIREYEKEYVRRNREAIRAKRKKYYEENKGKILSKNAEYRENHREEIKKYFRDRYKNLRREILDSQKEYNKTHREEKKEYLKAYYRANKTRLKEQNLRRQRERLRRDPSFKLKRQARLLIWRSFNHKEYTKPNRSEEILGCKISDFVSYLRQTWLDKYGGEWNGQPCHIDHIVPLAIAKTEEDIVRLCHYTNLRLLTPEDNMEKSDKLITKEEV